MILGVFGLTEIGSVKMYIKNHKSSMFRRLQLDKQFYRDLPQVLFQQTHYKNTLI